MADTPSVLPPEVLPPEVLPPGPGPPGGVEHEVVLGVVAVESAVAKLADRHDGAESGLLVGVESLYLVADRTGSGTASCSVGC